MFRGVTEMRLRQRIGELSIDVVSDDSIKLRNLGIQDRGDRHAFLISSRDFPNGYVVAMGLYLSEDHLSYGEPSTIDNRDLADQIVRSGYFY
jgi:hypothetical protein